MQRGLECMPVQYNGKRPNQGRNTNGMTPLQAFKKGLCAEPRDNGKAVVEKGPDYPALGAVSGSYHHLYNQAARRFRDRGR